MSCVECESFADTDAAAATADDAAAGAIRIGPPYTRIADAAVAVGADAATVAVAARASTTAAACAMRSAA